MRSLFALPLLVLALFAFAPAASSAAAAKPQVTSTDIDLPIAQTMYGVYIGPSFCTGFVTGTLKARFDATPIAGGFSVSAFFKPHGLSCVGDIQGTVSSKAIATTTLVPGVATPIIANYLKLDGSKVVVQCNLTVDASGVVSVSDVWLNWTTIHSCGGGNNGSGHQQGGGPCTGC
jgi:hypothetical protein